MKYSNHDMEQMLDAVEHHLDRRDVIGYAAARNSRILRDELREYLKVRDELVMKYGEADVDEKGNPIGSVSLQVTSEKFPDFLDEIGRFSTIEHEPDLFKLKYDEAIGQLSGKELLELEWMFED
ncbi:hypothetical protein [Adlercreutzia sp. ZJ242]|uniref:hypothetical protein n=1 Tax=Adlercreutzia sp. ZJ242 TaxID=2709409 RepID=UPI0013E9C593|nr:hypothetical protein [Adlercreutzia sp. ZJ242]